MALVNHAKREINAKIVFCGAEGAGKATLLKGICAKLPAENRGQLRSMSFQQDKMLFFDFSHPEGSDADGYSLRLHIYTITGEISQENAWKMVLKGVDGVAFVVDSRLSRQAANRQVFEQIQSALHAHGKRITDLPSVIVLTKQDLPEAVSPEQLLAGIPASSLPVYTADASSGSDVLNPLCELLEGILVNLEALGLPLQPFARDLCLLAPERAGKASAIGMETPQLQEPPIDDITSQPVSGSASFALDGLPEIAADGSLYVGVKVTCCGRTSKAKLRISISDGN